MNNSNQPLLDRWFPTDEARNQALNDAYDVQIAQSIIKARHARNLSQNDLAKNLNVSQSYVSQLENASVLPSHKKLKEIARSLKAILLPPALVVQSQAKTIVSYSLEGFSSAKSSFSSPTNTIWQTSRA